MAGQRACGGTKEVTPPSSVTPLGVQEHPLRARVRAGACRPCSSSSQLGSRGCSLGTAGRKSSPKQPCTDPQYGGGFCFMSECISHISQHFTTWPDALRLCLSQGDVSLLLFHALSRLDILTGLEVKHNPKSIVTTSQEKVGF